MKWKPIKIEVSPAVREFNETVMDCDFLTDYMFDRQCAAELLVSMRKQNCYPHTTEALANAIAGLKGNA